MIRYISYMILCGAVLAGCSFYSENESGDKDNTNEVEPIKTVEQIEGDIFFVPSEKDNNITLIDLPSNEILGEIKTGERPANVAFAYEQNKAFVTHRNGNSVGVIDLQQLKMTKEIKVGVDPHALVLSNDNKMLFVTTVGDQFIYVIDTETEDVMNKIDLGSGARTNYPDLQGRTLYVTDHANNLVYQLVDEGLRTTYTVAGSPMVVRVNNKDSLIYVASSNYGAIEVFDSVSGNKVSEISSGDDVTDFVITKNGARLIATNKNEGSVSIIDLTKQSILKKVKNLAAPKHIAFNPDETKVYVSLSATNKVAVIDLETMALETKIKVGEKPHGVQLY